MRKLFLLILAFSFLFNFSFAAQSDFPAEFSSSKAVLLEYDSSGGTETASYASNDTRIVAIIERELMNKADWDKLEQQYKDSGLSSSYSHGLTHYYVCEDAGDSEYQCFVDVYKNGYYYTIDVSVLNSNQGETLGYATSMSAEMFGEPPQKPDNFICTPGVFLALLAIPVISKR